MEKDIRKLRTCERCKVEVPLAKVRLYARNEQQVMVLCEGCCDVLKKKGETPLTNSPKTMIRNVYQARESSTVKVIKENSPIKNLPTKTTLQEGDYKERPKILNRPQMKCRRCDYSFTISEPKSGASSKLGCPYCGKIDQLQRVTSM